MGKLECGSGKRDKGNRIECGSRNAECGMVKQRAEAFEWGSRNAEVGKGIRGQRLLNGEVGMRPPASPSCRLYEPEALGAYPPACKPMAYKPTGWKRPRKEVGIWRVS